MTLSFSTQARNKAKEDALKQHLLDCVQLEKKRFMRFADALYQQGGYEEKDQLAFCQQVIDTVDKILAQGDWESSLFLHNTAKPLQQVREQALQMKAALLAEAGEGDNKAPHAVSADKQLVYLSLFQANGQNLQQWAAQLASVNSHLLGRPVYENEEDIQKMIRRKQQQMSEAYAIVAVNKNDILNEAYQAPRQDRQGNKLLNLKAGSIKPDCILAFVHQGKHYRLDNHKLISNA